jgi:O-antigen biosynthesis protein
MRPACLQWLSEHAPDPKPGFVLDVGSYDVNGSARGLVESWGSHYLGVDMREGPNVDVVCAAEALDYELGAGAAGAVVCIDAAEHMEDWHACFAGMKAVCAEGGWVYLATVAPGWARHEYPGDYWRFTEDLLCEAFADFEVLASTPLLPAVLARKPQGWVPQDLSALEAFAVPQPEPVPVPRLPQGDPEGIIAQ